MKKIVLLVFSTLLMSVVFTGCGKSSAQKELDALKDSLRIADSIKNVKDSLLKDSIKKDSIQKSLKPKYDLSSIKKIIRFDDMPGGTLLFAGDTPNLKDVRIYTWDWGKGGDFSATLNGERISGKVKVKTSSEDICQFGDGPIMGSSNTWTVSLLRDSEVVEKFVCTFDVFSGGVGEMENFETKGFKTLKCEQFSGDGFSQKLDDAWI